MWAPGLGVITLSSNVESVVCDAARRQRNSMMQRRIADVRFSAALPVRRRYRV
jgi:hypothetical protein